MDTTEFLAQAATRLHDAGSTGVRESHVGRPAMGALYNRWMREQIAAVTPHQQGAAAARP